MFASVGGTTARVAGRLAEKLGETRVADLRREDPLGLKISGSCLILLCPTYGDQELEAGFERFLVQRDWRPHVGLHFAFAELGIYTGYEEFGHGLIDMVYATFLGNGLRELVPPLSLDTMPMSDWPMLDAWADRIARNRGGIHERS